MPPVRSTLIVCAVALLCACDGNPSERSSSDLAADTVLDSIGPPAADPTAVLPVLDGIAPFEPIDEGAAHPAFARFRDALLRAIEQRDTSALLAAVAPDIHNTFGDDNGRDAFRRIWDIDRPDSEVWTTLSRVLRNGGAFRVVSGDTLFMAPYVYAAWPGGHEAFRHVATLTDRALAREAPDSAGRVIGVLPHRIVSLGWPPSSERTEAWTEIELADGRRAWIASDDVYSPVGYRAIFAQRDGRWLMTVLIAGD